MPNNDVVFGARYVYAVDDVGLDIHPGEVFGLVSESGCGKTTVDSFSEFFVLCRRCTIL